METETTFLPLTLEEAKTLKVGTVLHQNAFCSAKYTRRWRVNGKPQVWKRSPDRVRVPIKHGLYAYDTIGETNLDLVHLASKCPFDHN